MSDEHKTRINALAVLSSSVLNLKSELALHEVDNLEQEARRILAAVQSAYAPIDKLPNEVLGRIFLLSQPQYDDFLSKWPTRRSLAWTAVARACRRWRLVATSFPALWTSLDLCHDTVDVGRVFLARSGDAPLTVSFSARDPALSE